MATYSLIRHIELDRIGQGKKRITRPPGGESSDIFGAASPTSTPPGTPRKVKNYMASTIFTPDANQQQVRSRHRPDDDSFKRLFGANEGKTVTDGGSAPTTPKKNVPKSNIVECLKHAEGTNKVAVTNGQNGHAPATNGTVNGITTNGHSNATTPSAPTTPSPTPTANGVAAPVGTTTTNKPVENGHAATTTTTNGINGHHHGGPGSTGSGSISSGPNSGSSTPSNGSINGDYKPTNGHATNGNGSLPVTPSRRIPPGGFSSKLW